MALIRQLLDLKFFIKQTAKDSNSKFHNFERMKNLN